MSQAMRIRRVSVEDYLRDEPEGEVRHEYVDGELFAMSGASRSHNTVVTNLTTALTNHLDGGPCRVASSDMKVRTGTGERYYYPDVIVSCGPVGDEPDDYTETRPSVIVEVLSPSTAQIDRREKRLGYQSIASLREYVLVDIEQRRVEVFVRDGVHDGWTVHTVEDDETMTLASIDCHLEVARLLRGLPGSAAA